MEKGRWLVRLAHGKEVLVRAECLESWAHMRPMPRMFQRSQHLSIRACAEDVLVEAPWPLPPEKGTNAPDTLEREACEKKRLANCNTSFRRINPEKSTVIRIDSVLQYYLPLFTHSRMPMA